MASTALLASKVVILEEDPNIPAIAALPSAVLQVLGVTERGPIADRTLVTSFDEYKKTFGGFTLSGDVAIAVYGFFAQGGSFAWVSRTVHFTDASDPATQTATTGSVMLQTDGTAAAPAILTGTESETFSSDPNVPLILSVDGGATQQCAPTGDSATLVSDALTFPITISAVSNPATMEVVVDGSYGDNPQDFSVPNGTYTREEFLAYFQNGKYGMYAGYSASDELTLVTDRLGSGAGIQITTAGELATILNFPTTKAVGTGNVFDCHKITAAEMQSIIEAAITGVSVVITETGALQIVTDSTGAAASIQVTALTALVTELGFDTDIHNGSDAAPEDTLLLSGKTAGSFTDDIQIAIEAATSGEAARFNLKVVVDGIVRETFPNVTMDTASTDYVETRINDENYGSNLVVAADQGLVYSALLKRPENGTSANMTGGGDGLTGLADIDYIGNQAGPTGLYCFDRVSSGRILIVPGVYTPGVHKGMIDYAETWRNGSMFCVLDCPPGQTAVQVITYVETTAALLEYSEFAAIYWPWIKIANPQSSVFGTSENITVPPSGFIAGKYAANDQKIGGVYESPAGIGGGFGVLRGIVGVEDDPSGSSIHEVEDERKRDLVYPKRINPITRLPGTSWHIDGGRTLKSTGPFPNIGERRGVIYIEQSIKQGVLIFKHRFNNKQTRRQAKRVVTVFLTQEMNKGAFRSNNADEAFFVDVSDQLNPTANEFAGIMTMRIGLATNKPAEYIVVLVTQDTRALEESLAAA